MVCALYCSADGSALLILPLLNGFPDGLRAVLLSGWQRIAHSPLVNGFSDGSRAVLLSGWQRVAQTYARQRLSRLIAGRIAARMAADCL